MVWVGLSGFDVDEFNHGWHAGGIVTPARQTDSNTALRPGSAAGEATSDPMNELTRHEIAASWGCSIRTVERTLRRFKAKPTRLTGLSPRFTQEEVDRIARARERAAEESVRRLSAAAKARRASGVITARQARAIAGGDR